MYQKLNLLKKRKVNNNSQKGLKRFLLYGFFFLVLLSFSSFDKKELYLIRLQEKGSSDIAYMLSQQNFLTIQLPNKSKKNYNFFDYLYKDCKFKFIPALKLRGFDMYGYCETKDMEKARFSLMEKTIDKSKISYYDSLAKLIDMESLFNKTQFILNVDSTQYTANIAVIRCEFCSCPIFASFHGSKNVDTLTTLKIIYSKRIPNKKEIELIEKKLATYSSYK